MGGLELTRCPRCSAEIRTGVDPHGEPRAFEPAPVWARVHRGLVLPLDLGSAAGHRVCVSFPAERSLGGPFWAVATIDGRRLEVLNGGCRALLLHEPRCSGAPR